MYFVPGAATKTMVPLLSSVGRGLVGSPSARLSLSLSLQLAPPPTSATSSFVRVFSKPGMDPLPCTMRSTFSSKVCKASTPPLWHSSQLVASLVSGFSGKPEGSCSLVGPVGFPQTRTCSLHGKFVVFAPWLAQNYNCINRILIASQHLSILHDTLSGSKKQTP